MKIAVTGASGFIGRHVLAELARLDLDVVAVARQVSAQEAAPRRRWVELDLLQPGDAWSALGAPDVLLHLAWGGLPNYKALRHFETELPAQYRFLSGMVRAGLGAIVTVGTCFEYGMRSGELDVGMEPVPTNPYGYAKDALRRQLQMLRAVHPFRLSWGRIFYVYGSGQSSGSLLPQLEAAVAAGKTGFNMSPGDQVRDFVPVSQVARDLVFMATSSREFGVVNLCSGVPVTVREFVERQIADRGWKISLNPGHYPYPDYEPMSFWGRRTPLG